MSTNRVLDVDSWQARPPTSTGISSALRALQIPEIVQYILSFVPSEYLPVCARVCRRWLDPALSLIWRTLDQPEYLFNTLSFLQFRSSTYARPGYESSSRMQTLHFLSRLNSSDWDRFLYYADHVRELRFEHYEGMLDCSVFAEFARSRPVLTPFRRLQRLYIDPSQYSIGMKYIVLFLCEGLEELDIADSQPERNDQGFLSNIRMIRDLLYDVAYRATGLKRLRLNVHAPGRQLTDVLVDTILKLRKLTEFDISPCLVTPMLVLALSQLPELSVFKVDSHRISRTAASSGLCEVIEEPFPDPRGTVFPSLEALSLQGQLIHITPFFSSKGSFACLNSLAVDMTVDSTGTRVRDLLEHVADVCPFIQSIELSRIRDLGSYAIQSTQKDPVTVHSLRPTWKMKNLYELFVSSPYPVQIGDDDLNRFLSEQDALDKLDSLELGAEPIHFKEPVMTLYALIYLASLKRRWKILRLYVQTHMVLDCLAVLDTAKERIEFADLEQLEIAFSPIQEEHIDNIAIFLSKIIPSTCELFTDDYLGVEYDDSTHMNAREVPSLAVMEARSRKGMWRIVKQKLEVQHRARLGDRRRLIEMERKIVELETRGI